MKILGTGLTGLVGSRIVELLSHKHSFNNLGRIQGIDITNSSSFQNIKNNGSEIVIHLAAKTDVDACERDKELGEKGEAWKVNVAGTQNVIKFCKKNNLRVIYISTDFVFDGEKQGGYSEDDMPNPINWYAKTKYEGEKTVQNSGVPFLIIRLAYPYRASFTKVDFMRAIKTRLENNQNVMAVTDHVFCPTFIDDISYAIDMFAEYNERGIYHVVGSQAFSPYDTALLVAEQFGLDSGLIHKTTRAEYFNDRAQRPFNLELRNDKIQQLGIRMKTFGEGLQEVARQLQNF